MEITKRRPRTKVKTGCRTCKIRKVKCDEGRPACTRCTSMGRACEGYGVWGGGSTGVSPGPVSSVAAAAAVRDPTCRRRFQSLSAPRQLFRGIPAPLSAQEYGSLDWFRRRTAVKLRGAFSMSFWDTLVIRASLEEPAILHAALALGTVHRCVGGGEGMGTGAGQRSAVTETYGEEFALRQYNKAIWHLTAATSSPTGPTQDVASTRIVLVACMLFTCLEFMRGHFQTGNNHLQNGVRLLAGLLVRPGRKQAATAADPYSLIMDRHHPRANMDQIDKWLLEAFARMNLLAAQFGHGYSGPLLPATPHYFFSPDHQLLCLPITFASVSQARNILDQLVYDVFTLAGQCRQHPLTDDSLDTQITANLAREQARLAIDLHAWHATYRASRSDLYSRLDGVDMLARVAYQMLVLYYDMAAVLVAACLAPDSELAFDEHGDRFLSILRNALLFLHAVRDVHNSQDPIFQTGPEYGQLGSAASPPLGATAPTVCLFNADVGWTPPLYFTALHCRVSRVRKQAARFILSIPSREGLWDSRLAGAVAEEVIRLEERGLSPSSPKMPNGFVPHGPFLDEELFQDGQSPELLPLPASHPRIQNVRVVLPDSWSGTTMLACEKRWSDGMCEAIQRFYDPATQQWSPP